jgi:hypothetical protein
MRPTLLRKNLRTARIETHAPTSLGVYNGHYRSPSPVLSVLLMSPSEAAMSDDISIDWTQCPDVERIPVRFLALGW